LQTSSDADAITSLWKFQGMIVLTLKNFSYIKMKHLIVQLVPIAPCLLHVVLCEESAFVIFVTALQVLEN